MTRVIHTGDTHLGYRQYHSPERRADFLEAFRRVVEDAVEGDVDAVVHAGDLFHDRSPALDDVHGAIQVLAELREAGVPFLAVVGNHERTQGGQWLDLLATLGLATRLGREPTVVGSVAFYGLDYVPPSRRDELEYEFAPHDAEHAALVAHGPFEPFVPEVRNDRWDLPAALEAASVEFDAALLGDDHTPDTRDIDGTWATYCGSTERVDASEREPRGYNVVEFDGDVRVSRRGLATRRFVLVDLDLAPGEGIDRVRTRLVEEDLDGAVVVVRVAGEGEPVHPARVEEFATDRGALVARVSDRREIETLESAPTVSFTDPDEAVTERVRELGLSEAATAIDLTVRDDGVANANVRERVRERVEALLEDDPGALVPTGDDPEPETAGGDAGNGDASEPPTPESVAGEGGATSHEETPEDTEAKGAGDDGDERSGPPDQPAEAGDDPAGGEAGATTIEDFL